jgi:hypothetical protein
MRNLKEATFRRSPEALYRRVGGDILLATPGREDFDTLSATGSATWDLLETPRDLAELVDVLASNYDVPPQSIVSDVAALLLELHRRGWIQEVEE